MPNAFQTCGGAWIAELMTDEEEQVEGRQEVEGVVLIKNGPCYSADGVAGVQ